MAYTLTFPLIDRYSKNDINPTWTSYQKEFVRITNLSSRKTLKKVLKADAHISRVFTKKSEAIRFIKENKFDEVFLPSEYSLTKHGKAVLIKKDDRGIDSPLARF
jgi:hypothetical protein